MAILILRTSQGNHELTCFMLTKKWTGTKLKPVALREAQIQRCVFRALSTQGLWAWLGMMGDYCSIDNDVTTDDDIYSSIDYNVTTLQFVTVLSVKGLVNQKGLDFHGNHGVKYSFLTSSPSLPAKPNTLAVTLGSQP
ncbi:hypothetical protein AAES_78734 [Amazona aestiva]|uniref:Uncharacterized protein n=1 Tax=Amazona aestiva TaxID=12930 RepID=A0A0Q3UT35_AMAAE|nr:hypothetical protein AAES_78734 [Amazona aestiva]